MSLTSSKEWAESKNHGLIDTMVKKLCHHIDFDTIKTIYDIGSRDALQSIELSNAFPSANIYAFEPNPEALVTCYNNTKDIKNIKMCPVAVSNIDGEISFFAQDLEKSHDVNIGVSSMLKLMDQTPYGWHWIQKEIKVKSTTLNTFVADGNPAPDLMWVDVQGAELLVFKGASHILPNVKAIFTEAGNQAYYHGHTMINEIDQYLSSFRFHSVLKVFGHQWESDFLYIKTDGL